MLELILRKRTRLASRSDHWQLIEQPVRWVPAQTAAIVCDMWDQHWCRGATERVKELAPRVNLLVAELRRRGVLIIHAPSETLDFYRRHPALELARSAPPVKTHIPLQSWMHLDPNREAPLPIDDSDASCDCQSACTKAAPWRRQIEALDIQDGDAISDGFEAYYLICQRSIQNVLIMGVHINMCVLGRPFGIRQMVSQGLNVVLMRDLTDSMYNSRLPPAVDHFSATDLMIVHIEKYWCSSITSDQIIGGHPFQFAADNR